MNSTNFTLHFSGHETFALRYGWLNKAYNILNINEKDIEKQVVELGVGKNMVNSIKYWADVSGLVPLQNQENNKINYEFHLERPTNNYHMSQTMICA